MKLLQIHTDLDGVSCAIVARYFKLSFDKISCMNYDDYEKFDYDSLAQYDEIWYADFSPDLKALAVIEANGIKCKIFDHHTTSNQWLKDADFIEYHYTTEKSGALILLDYCKENYSMRIKPSFQQFIDLVSIYDTWKENDPLFDTSVDLNNLLYKKQNWNAESPFKKMLPFIEYMYEKIMLTDEFEFNYWDKGVIAKERDTINQLTQDTLKNMKVRKDEKGYTFAMAKLGKKCSIVAHYVLKQKPDLDYILIINTYQPDAWKGSLRSKKLDLQGLNKAMGHEHACGMEDVSNEYFYGLWEGRQSCIGWREEKLLTD